MGRWVRLRSAVAGLAALSLATGGSAAQVPVAPETMTGAAALARCVGPSLVAAFTDSMIGFTWFVVDTMQLPAAADPVLRAELEEVFATRAGILFAAAFAPAVDALAIALPEILSPADLEGWIAFCRSPAGTGWTEAGMWSAPVELSMGLTFGLSAAAIDAIGRVNAILRDHDILEIPVPDDAALPAPALPPRLSLSAAETDARAWLLTLPGLADFAATGATNLTARMWSGIRFLIPATASTEARRQTEDAFAIAIADYVTVATAPVYDRMAVRIASLPLPYREDIAGFLASPLGRSAPDQIVRFFAAMQETMQGPATNAAEFDAAFATILDEIDATLAGRGLPPLARSGP